MENAKIMVVDDDADLSSSIRAILESKGHTVVTASSKSEGMARFKEEKPDLAILDVMMDTWQDGFEIARELKQDPELRDMPIIMLTAVKDKTGINFKDSAGDPTWLPVDCFLDKPVESGTLLSEIEKLLSKK